MIPSFYFLFLKVTISSALPLWLSVFCLAFGVGLSYLLYRKNRTLEEVSRNIRYLLFSLRALYLSILAFLLLSPFVLSLDPVVEKPLLIFGQDRSASISYSTDSNTLNSYGLERDAFLKKVEENFEVKYYDFGEKVNLNEGSDLYEQRTTDISSFLKEVKLGYENRNVALMVLASDGLYNRGENPIYTSSNLPFPLYSLALGDTAQRKDLWVEEVKHNKIAFVENSFEVEVEIAASLLQNSSARVRILQDGAVLSNKTVRISRSDFISKLSFEILAKEVGLHRYEVEILPLDDEVSIENNNRYFFVEVLEGRQEILILTNSPHPDVSALVSAINTGKNFRAISSNVKSFNGNFKDYDLVILNQVPSIYDRNSRIEDRIGDIPRLYILGKASNIRKFEAMDVGIKLTRFKNQFNESTPLLNADFHFFSINNENVKSIMEFPPLISPFAEYEISNNDQNLFYQKIGNVETQYPLWSFVEDNGRKDGIIAGEGLWRWRLFDHRLNGSTHLFDELIKKTVQYLSLREDKSRFRVNAEPSYFENNNVVISAEYYDKTYELNNEFEADLILFDESGNEFNFEFLRNQDTYMTDLGNLDVGEYRWKANLNDGSSIFTREGEFSIKPLQLENTKLQADHAFLFNLATKTGGNLIYPEDLKELAVEIEENPKFKPLLHYNERMKDLISFAILFVVLLLLLSAEWFIRKYLGLN